MHLGKGFLDLKSVFPKQDDHFRLWIITGIMIGKKMDGFPVISPETGSMIGDTLMDEQVREPFKDPYSDSPVGR